MKILDAKSFAAGLVTGTLGITTVFAATGIQSAVLSGTAIPWRSFLTAVFPGKPLLRPFRKEMWP